MGLLKHNHCLPSIFGAIACYRSKKEVCNKPSIVFGEHNPFGRDGVCPGTDHLPAHDVTALQTHLLPGSRPPCDLICDLLTSLPIAKKMRELGGSWLRIAHNTLFQGSWQGMQMLLGCISARQGTELALSAARSCLVCRTHEGSSPRQLSQRPWQSAPPLRGTSPCPAGAAGSASA